MARIIIVITPKKDRFRTNKIVGTIDIITCGDPNYCRSGKSSLCCVGQATVGGICTILNFGINASIIFWLWCWGGCRSRCTSTSTGTTTCWWVSICAITWVKQSICGLWIRL